MRLLIFSDSHGNIRRCIDVIDRIVDIDMIIHLGDIVRDAGDLRILYPNIPVEFVAGNNDYYYKYSVPSEKVLEIGDKKIFITHGHLYRVKYEYDTIINKGISLKADAILFGHTHEAYETYKNGMLVLNPGSISLPKWGNYSYGVIEMYNNKLTSCICNHYL